MPLALRAVPRLACLVTTLGFLPGCGLDATVGTTRPPPKTQVGARPPAPPQVVWHTPIGMDMVGKGDSAIHPDGEPDATLAAQVEGPIDGLLLVITDPSGTPCSHQQWDTVVGQDPLPPIGSGLDGVGADTWVLGVMENDVMRNDPTGRVALGPGRHSVLLTASSTGSFHAGQFFRLMVHHPGAPEWAGSPVVRW